MSEAENPSDLAGFFEAMAQAADAHQDEQVEPETLRSRAEQITERLNLQNEMAFIGMAGESGDDERVTATADGRGQLTGLEISPYAMRDMDAEQLGVACAEAIKAARAQAVERMNELSREFRPDASIPEVPAELVELARNADPGAVFRRSMAGADEWVARRFEQRDEG